MKKRTLLGVFIVVLSASSAFDARASSDGRGEAFNFCSKLTFKSSVDACLQVVRQAHYFDVDALTVCGALSFESSKVDCVRVIAERVAAPRDLSEEGALFFAVLADDEEGRFMAVLIE